MKCPKCQKDYEGTYEFCPYCGEKKPAEVEVTPTPAPSPPTVTTTPPGTTPGMQPTPSPITPPPLMTREKKSIKERWGSLSVKGKGVVIGIGVVILIIIIVSAVTGSKKGTVEETTPAVTETTTSEPSESTKTAGDFITTEVYDGQEVTSGPLMIKGTVKEDCTITLNGQPVGIEGATKQFAPTINVVEGDNALAFVVTDSQGNAYTKSLKLVGVLSPEAYRAVSPPLLAYAELNKNPEGYAGTRCKFKGQVAQAMVEGDETMLRVNVTDTGYGIWDDTVYVTIKGTTPAVENSIVMVYGTITGSKTYESQAGWNITIPAVEAKYVDVVG
jgi:hypothetical protein